ncbi:High-affinity branched-chain amino acid transport system permease protein LivH [Candidatus Rhodobacter oscarellae]|uniref:High-affinity branched-chain amino acid transport system permease protein LivH n=1 Tax=Candidatus Rhodobacter oscarellae TaxID=1675527 RepID=A0A0J9E943_9RHOB|nr:branched-chain amino acid ABC transporter permease [Candidatus Rhodobacter lobularis]KMW59312.1 High-affinity branched-chain amino acid transport system permease protein LivH [Candidatus Rhodobacter lobularis]
MLQILIQGLLLSGLYALIAMGFTLIFSVGRVLNLAYGAYLLIGGYAYFYFSQQLGLPKIAGVMLAGVLGCVLGLLKYQLLVKRVQGVHSAVEIATLILAVVLQSAVVLIFGDSSKILLPIVPGVERVASAAIPYSNLVATIISWAILIGLYFFVRLTHTGRAMQAVSMDAKGAAISGIDANRINMITWGISGTLGAIGGVFFASYTQLYPGMWVAPLIIAVAVVIVGGIGSIIGTLVVAHIVGFMEIIVSSWNPELRGVFTMLLIILVLVLRPRGLFGREEIH